MTSVDKTSLDKIERAPVGSRGTTSAAHLAAELGETLKLAAPIALTQLGQIAMMATPSSDASARTPSQQQPLRARYISSASPSGWD